jgi:NCAIR mutase (PurE)-related protein
VTREQVRELLRRLRSGEIGEEQALEQLARLPFSEIGDARVDTHRALRQGLPEVVLGLGKSTDQITRIVRELRSAGVNVLVTRVEPEVARAVREEIPELTHHPEGRALTLRQSPSPPVGRGTIVVVTAGTSDVPVAEEAALTAELFGNKVERLYDVGVAGIHRLLASLDVLRSAEVAIVAAGMEGALPSVVGGLIDRPVIAVPTSVGYGASFGGIAALLAMLNACSPNVTAVNIDNGFGAAFVASLINRA